MGLLLPAHRDDQPGEDAGVIRGPEASGRLVALSIPEDPGKYWAEIRKSREVRFIAHEDEIDALVELRLEVVHGLILATGITWPGPTDLP